MRNSECKNGHTDLVRLFPGVADNFDKILESNPFLKSVKNYYRYPIIDFAWPRLFVSGRVGICRSLPDVATEKHRKYIVEDVPKCGRCENLSENVQISFLSCGSNRKFAIAYYKIVMIYNLLYQYGT